MNSHFDKGINRGRHSNLLYEAIEEDKANGLKLSRKAVLITSIVIILLAEGIKLQLYERAAARVTHVASPRILMLRGKSKIRNAEVTQGSHDTDGGREHLCTRTWMDVKAPSRSVLSYVTCGDGSIQLGTCMKLHM